MGLIDRLKAARKPVPGLQETRLGARTPVISIVVHGGDDDLEVVGEASYQDALWAICRGSQGDRIRHRIVAILVPEPENPHDANAISVQISGSVVGYFPRDVAARYAAGLRAAMARCGGYVALEGVIVGGGYYDGNWSGARRGSLILAADR